MTSYGFPPVSWQRDLPPFDTLEHLAWTYSVIASLSSNGYQEMRITFSVRQMLFGSVPAGRVPVPVPLPVPGDGHAEVVSRSRCFLLLAGGSFRFPFCALPNRGYECECKYKHEEEVTISRS